MPLIVLPGAPAVTPPVQVVSPDGWLTAVVDTVWAGVLLSVDYTAAPVLPGAAQVLQVRITRQDPGASVPVLVRSADPAWAVEGVGAGYDHEAPLGVPVIYTATAVYADGTAGPSSSVSVTVPAPVAGVRDDLWLKSLDEPGLSARVMVVDRPTPTSAGRQETTDIPGSPYIGVAWDTHGAEVRPLKIDVRPERVDQVRALLRSGVLLAQVRPGYGWPDVYGVPGEITGPTPTGRLGASGGYQFEFTLTPIARPPTAGQPLMIPGWTYDAVAAGQPSYDALAVAYSTYGALATNGTV
ncbi:hypothetical protein ACFV0R_19115 [Streptomyces sp. NPDC059578]|uniref:hypothetical protein n=1 Tax=Streptomyces sp. NPDC059578 TaxID=3346874 RepID=UPI0036A21D31